MDKKAETGKEGIGDLSKENPKLRCLVCGGLFEEPASEGWAEYGEGTNKISFSSPCCGGDYEEVSE